MALPRLRLKPFLPRPFSSSSSSSIAAPLPPAPSEPTNSAADPPPPSTPSPFTDIRDRLKYCPSSSPPRPATSSLDDVRRSLNLFRNPQPAASSPTPSFLDILTSRTTSASSPTPTNRTSSPSPFEGLRESLHKLSPAAGPLPGAKPLDWMSVFSQRQRPGAQPLPERVFGRELKERVGKGHGGAQEGLQFLRSYSYDELGKRLGDSRPAGAGKDGKEWFSSEELNGRLGRLREMDKELKMSENDCMRFCTSSSGTTYHKNQAFVSYSA